MALGSERQQEDSAGFPCRLYIYDWRQSLWPKPKSCSTSKPNGDQSQNLSKPDGNWSQNLDESTSQTIAWNTCLMQPKTAECHQWPICPKGKNFDLHFCWLSVYTFLTLIQSCKYIHCSIEYISIFNTPIDPLRTWTWPEPVKGEGEFGTKIMVRWVGGRQVSMRNLPLFGSDSRQGRKVTSKK